MYKLWWKDLMCCSRSIKGEWRRKIVFSGNRFLVVGNIIVMFICGYRNWFVSNSGLNESVPLRDNSRFLSFPRISRSLVTSYVITGFRSHCFDSCFRPLLEGDGHTRTEQNSSLQSIYFLWRESTSSNEWNKQFLPKKMQEERSYLALRKILLCVKVGFRTCV